MASDPWSRPTRLVPVGLAISIVFVVLALVRFNFTIDDAYITFRYADNLASGQGAVYNPGERVEGYTSPLWLFLLAAAIRSGLDPVFFGKLFGLACAAATIFLMVVGSARIAGTSPVSRIVGASLLAASTPVMLWAVGGLETPMFLLLVTASVLCFHAEWLRRRFRWTGILYALATLTRPEGLAFFLAAVLSWGLLKIRDEDRVVRRDEVMTAFLFVAPALAHVAWRYWYYGDVLPNTYHAKARFDRSADPHSRGLLEDRRLRYFRGFLLAHACLPLIGLIVPLRALRRHPGDGESSTTMIVFLPFMLVPIVCSWVVHGDWMPGYRFLLPMLPLAYLFAASLVGPLGNRIATMFPAWSRTERARGGSVVAITAVVIGRSECIRESDGFCPRNPPRSRSGVSA